MKNDHPLNLVYGVNRHTLVAVNGYYSRISHTASGFKINSTVTEARLRRCHFGEAGSTVLAHSLRLLPNLEHLDLTGNNCGSAGGKAIGTVYLKVLINLMRQSTYLSITDFSLTSSNATATSIVSPS